jgi:4-hydroxy-4-methyl-2-oxoglutarate aldolase
MANPQTEAAAILRDLPTATIYEAAGKAGALSRLVQRLADSGELSGFAFTVRCPAYETQAVFRAIDTAAPGDVLVIDAGEDGATVWGGSSTIAARQRGLCGLVTNGAVRDVEEILADGFPVYCLGPTVLGTSKKDRGDIQIPIILHGQPVQPGDFIRGDTDGVVVVRSERIVEIAAASLRQRAKEQRHDDALRSGARISELLGTQPAGHTG